MNTSWALQDRFLGRFFVGSSAGDFYLTDGTALTRFYFQLHESDDLDLFTNDQAKISSTCTGFCRTAR